MPIDPSAQVAPTARIHPDAGIGPRCVIGEYCVIEADTSLGPGCVLEPYVFIKRWTTMGEGNQISAGACLGTDPLDKAFTGNAATCASETTTRSASTSRSRVGLSPGL